MYVVTGISITIYVETCSLLQKVLEYFVGYYCDYRLGYNKQVFFVICGLHFDFQSLPCKLSVTIFA
jgi:hypothetical protein